jgi:DNA polymerase-3 subunit delta'
MARFMEAKDLPDPELRIALAEGSPGIAVSLDIDQFRRRRSLLLAAFECGAGIAPFSAWVQQSEPFGMSKSEKLDLYLKLAYGILEDVLMLSLGRNAAKNRDEQQRLQRLAEKVNVAWIERAVRCLDELVLMVRRNIQKTAALDAMIIILRNAAQVPGA